MVRFPLRGLAHQKEEVTWQEYGSERMGIETDDDVDEGPSRYLESYANYIFQAGLTVSSPTRS